MYMGLFDILSLALFILNIFLSILAGKKYAQLKHDVDLVRKRLGFNPMLFIYLPLYLLLIAIICINICYMIFSHGLSLMFSTFLGVLGIISNPYMGFIISIVLITFSYIYYSHKYKKIDEPLTRYVKLVMKRKKKS